jgi:hypothetical protein
MVVCAQRGKRAVADERVERAPFDGRAEREGQRHQIRRLGDDLCSSRRAHKRGNAVLHDRSSRLVGEGGRGGREGGEGGEGRVILSRHLP